MLDDQNCSIPETDFRRLAKYHLKPGDLLVSVVGTLGNVSIVTDDVGPCVFSCKSTAFRPKGVDPFFLCAYLISAIGQAYFRRLPRGHIQTGLNLPDLKGIPVPRLSSDAETAIGNLVRRLEIEHKNRRWQLRLKLHRHSSRLEEHMMHLELFQELCGNYRTLLCVTAVNG